MKALLGEAWRTWRWAEANALILANVMVMASAESGSSGSLDTGNPKLMMDHQSSIFSSLMSLFGIFVVGVTTGLFWKAANLRMLATRRLQVEPSSREIVAVTSEPTPPAMISTTITNSSPRLSRSVTVGVVKEYTLEEILDMTDNFRCELGRGGQGVVYSGMSLRDEPISRKLAIKKLQNGSNALLHNIENRPQAIIEKEFWGELNTISRLHHRNLVALLGFCVEGDELFLVYEYMAKGSLDQLLHPRNLEGAPPFNWKARMRCAAEVAQGLEYLHSHAEPSLVHRDVKSGNNISLLVKLKEESHCK